MAHFAKLNENKVVIEVNVVDNKDIKDLSFPESEPVGIVFLNNWSGNQDLWKQTSYNGKFRKNYAGIGFSYDIDRDAFIPPKPYQSWILNEETCLWDPPVPYPADGDFYTWDEETLAWIKVDEQKAELATYRQALLDIPQQSGFPLEVTWPVRPEFI